MSSAFMIVQQVQPETDTPFRVVEVYISAEGPRTRMCGGTYATFDRAQGEIKFYERQQQKAFACATCTEIANDLAESWAETGEITDEPAT